MEVREILVHYNLNLDICNLTTKGSFGKVCVIISDFMKKISKIIYIIPQGITFFLLYVE